ncbi:DinB family protein [Flavobacterium sp.]|uniref:DinB family protein n=1 Tax=Flavobacterium sp. TaxID=239 RepID=UPI003D6B5B24
MREPQRIAALFSALYNGEPWIDINLVDTLRNIPYQKAAEKYKDCNSIWEIANHIIAWRENVWQRVQDKVINTPQHNYFEKVAVISEEAWQTTLQNLAESQHKWITFLENCSENEFYKV